MCPAPRSDAGPIKNESPLGGDLGVEGCTASVKFGQHSVKTTSHKQQQKMLLQGKKRARSDTRESVANTSEAISSDNLPTFVSNVPDMTSLSATSAPDSTGR